MIGNSCDCKIVCKMQKRERAWLVVVSACRHGARKIKGSLDVAGYVKWDVERSKRSNRSRRETPVV